MPFERKEPTRSQVVSPLNSTRQLRPGGLKPLDKQTFLALKEEDQCQERELRKICQKLKLT